MCKKWKYYEKKKAQAQQPRSDESWLIRLMENNGHPGEGINGRDIDGKGVDGNVRREP